MITPAGRQVSCSPWGRGLGKGFRDLSFGCESGDLHRPISALAGELMDPKEGWCLLLVDIDTGRAWSQTNNPNSVGIPRKQGGKLRVC